MTREGNYLKKYRFAHNDQTFTADQLDEQLEPIRNGSLKADSRFRQTFKLVEGPSVLDVGCSIGAVSYTLAKDHPDWDILGVDILEDSVSIANDKMTLPNTRYEVRDILTNPVNANTFDCVIFLETIEHVDVPGQFIREFYRALKPGGCLVISTPNALAVQSFARHFGQDIKKRLHAIKDEPHNTGSHLEHVGLYDVYTLARMLDRNGFDYVEHHYARFHIPLSRQRYVQLGLFETLLKPMCDTVIIKARKRM